MKRLKRNWIFSILMLVFPLFFKSQIDKHQTSNYLRLKKKVTSIQVSPDTSILYRWREENIITITSSNPAISISRVSGLNLDVEKIGESIYRLKPHFSDTVNFDGGKLQIFVKDIHGKNILHSTKSYSFLDPEMPKVYINRVENDSVIEIKDLIFSKLYAKYKDLNVEVLAYTLEFIVEDELNQIIELSNVFKIETRNLFRKMNVPNTLTFYNVKIMLPSGYIENIPIATFFVIDNKER